MLSRFAATAACVAVLAACDNSAPTAAPDATPVASAQREPVFNPSGFEIYSNNSTCRAELTTGDNNDFNLFLTQGVLRSTRVDQAATITVFAPGAIYQGTGTATIRGDFAPIWRNIVLTASATVTNVDDPTDTRHVTCTVVTSRTGGTIKETITFP
jgi:hypothetical protein